MIPKIIHIAWNDKHVLKNRSPLIVEGVARLAAMNPEWDMQISDDADIDAYLQAHMGEHYPLVAEASIVAKTDIWRLYKMHHEGGLYVDIDRYCNVKLDEVIPEGAKQVLPTCREYDFSHDIMLSEPENPIYKTAIQAYISRRKDGHNNIYFLGAQTYMHAITFALFRKVVDTNPGEQEFAFMRDAIDSSGVIRTYREDPPYDTFLYRDEGGPRDWEFLKRKLYADYGLRHWTGEW